MSSRLWEVSKKASIAGLVFVSLPVLVPSALLLAFAGAVVAVPLGSAAVGFVVVKKIYVSSRPKLSHYLGWWSDDGDKEEEGEEECGQLPLVADRTEASTSSSSSSSSHEKKDDGHQQQRHATPHASGEISCELVPEEHSAPGKPAEDYIVVEKPPPPSAAAAEAKRGKEEEKGAAKAESQCKGAPDYFQCVEAEMAGEVGGAAGMEARARADNHKGGVADVDVDDAKDKEGSGGKNHGVGLGVLLGDGDKPSGPEKDHDDKQKIAAAAAAAADSDPVGDNTVSSVEGQDQGKEEARSSVDEYVSMTEDFPEEPNVVSSDESVNSNAAAAAAASATAAPAAGKPEVPEKEKRARLRKEITALKKVTGYRDNVGGSLAGQVEGLYCFMGVELPSGCSGGSDYGKLLEAVGALKAVVGVK